MSNQQQQLGKHKDSIKDRLEGVLSTVSKIPSIIHAQTSTEVIVGPSIDTLMLHCSLLADDHDAP